LSVVLETGEALVGDSLSSGILLGGIALTGRPKRPPFDGEAAQTARGLESLVAQGVHRFYIGHGAPLSRSAVERHIRALRNTQLAEPRS
jgi:hypothetical protein